MLVLVLNDVTLVASCLGSKDAVVYGAFDIDVDSLVCVETKCS